MLRRLVLAAAAFCVTFATAQDQPREQIGEVLGKPVFRDQLSKSGDDAIESALHDVFIRPVLERYQAEHRAETAPTDQELDTATGYFQRDHAARIAPKAAKLRAELAKIEARLKTPDVPVEEQETLHQQKFILEAELKLPDRFFAEFVLSSWKLERHLYVTYGGGRVLWQQRGHEAFDATRAWLQDQEKAGAFKITDDSLRKIFYAYWTTKDHGSFLFSDEERIRKEFLEPPWARSAASQPASHPSSAPTTQRADQRPRAP